MCFLDLLVHGNTTWGAGRISAQNLDPDCVRLLAASAFLRAIPVREQLIDRYGGGGYQPSHQRHYSHEAASGFATRAELQLQPPAPPSYPPYDNHYQDSVPLQHFAQQQDFYTAESKPFQAPPTHAHQVQPYPPQLYPPPPPAIHRSPSHYPQSRQPQESQPLRSYEPGTAAASASDNSSPSSPESRSADGRSPFASSSRAIPVPERTTQTIGYTQVSANGKTPRVGKEKEGRGVAGEAERQGRKSNSCAPCRKRKTRQVTCFECQL